MSLFSAPLMLLTSLSLQTASPATDLPFRSIAALPELDAEGSPVPDGLTAAEAAVLTEGERVLPVSAATVDAILAELADAGLRCTSGDMACFSKVGVLAGAHLVLVPIRGADGEPVSLLLIDSTSEAVLGRHELSAEAWSDPARRRRVVAELLSANKDDVDSPASPGPALPSADPPTSARPIGGSTPDVAAPHPSAQADEQRTPPRALAGPDAASGATKVDDEHLDAADALSLPRALVAGSGVGIAAIGLFGALGAGSAGFVTGLLYYSRRDATPLGLDAAARSSLLPVQNTAVVIGAAFVLVAVGGAAIAAAGVLLLE